MKKIHHQTKQAFIFSVVFYLISAVLLVMNFSIAPVLFSISLLLSMIWVVLVIKEIMLSMYVDQTEKIILILFIILLNVLAGLAYFFLIRKKVLGTILSK